MDKNNLIGSVLEYESNNSIVENTVTISERELLNSNENIGIIGSGNFVGTLFTKSEKDRDNIKILASSHLDFQGQP